MNIMNHMMIPATNHHPPPSIFRPQNHPPSSQNHPIPPQNHLSQNIQTPSSSLANHQQHPTLPQYYFSLANLEFFLHRMTENQEKHQQQLVQLLHRALTPSSIPQRTHSSVPYNNCVVSTVSADLMQKTAPYTVQSTAAGSQLFQACPHTSNTFLRIHEATPSHTAAPGNFSPLEGDFLGQKNCFFPPSVELQVTNGGPTVQHHLPPPCGASSPHNILVGSAQTDSADFMQKFAENTVHCLPMPTATFSSSPQLSSIITRSVTPLSSPTVGQFTFPPVETSLVSKKKKNSITRSLIG